MSEDFFRRYSYDINEDRLGSGAFGTVYKAYDNFLNTFKAIKISEVRYIDGKRFSLQEEYKASKEIPVHKNIAHYESVHQFKMPNGLYDYAIMQYYPEGNLKRLLAQKNLNEKDKKGLIDGLLQGISFLHKHNVIHRDIKPSNVLIARDQSGMLVPKISDFGLSKLLGLDSDHSFSSSFVGGTLDYSSPEQLYGKRLRINSDLWSFGVICFEILTGEKPFDISDFTGSPDVRRKLILRNISQGHISDSIHKCPYPYCDMIKMCLVVDPGKRIASGEDLKSFLNKPFEIELEDEEELTEDELTLIFEKNDDDENFDLFDYLKEKFGKGKGNPDRKKKDKEGRVTEEQVLKEIGKEKEDDENDNLIRFSEMTLQVQKLLEKEDLGSAKTLMNSIEKKFTLEGEFKEKYNALIAKLKSVSEKVRRDESEKIIQAGNNHYEKASELTPRNKNLSGLISQTKKEHEEYLLEQARKKEINDRVSSLIQGAENMVIAGEFKKALEHLGKAAQLQPQNAAIQNRKDQIEALIKEKIQKDELEAKAKLEFDKTIRQAEALVQKEQFQEAIEKYSKALDIQPQADGISQRINYCKRKIEERQRRKKKGLFWWRTKFGKFKIILSAVVIGLFLVGGYIVVKDLLPPGKSSRAEFIFSGDKYFLSYDGVLLSEAFDTLFYHNDEIYGSQNGRIYGFNGMEFEYYEEARFIAGLLINNFRNFIQSIDELELLREIQITTNDPLVLEKVEDRIQEKAEEEYSEIIENPDIQFYERFLKRYPDSRRTQEIARELQNLIKIFSESQSEDELFKEIVELRSRDLAREYLERYPNGQYRNEVENLISEMNFQEENRLWNNIKSNPSTEKIEDFLNVYPQSRHADEALRLKEDLTRERELSAWDRIKARRNLLEVKDFLSTVANPEIQMEARDFLKHLELEEQEWNKISESNNPEDFDRYIFNYPESPYIKDAIVKKEALESRYEEMSTDMIVPEESEFIRNLNMDFVFIQGGMHKLGCDQDFLGCDSREGTKEINLGSFYISKYEVTQRLFEAVTGENPSFFTECPECPVENLTFEQIKKFLNNLNNLPGNPYIYRLPTEAEWEFSAIAGGSYKFAGSDNANNVAVINERGGSQKVGSKRPNAFGVYDMSGNVAEYCIDWYGDFATGRSDRQYRVVRGGSWNDREGTAMVKRRNKADPRIPHTFIGFRLVREP